MPEQAKALLLGAPGQRADFASRTIAGRAATQSARHVARALTSRPARKCSQEIGDAAGLRGRGGAGILAAEKLALVAHAASETRYLICNAYDADVRSQNARDTAGAQSAPGD